MGFPGEVLVMQQQIRTTIKQAVPDAEKTISYAMPAFKYHGTLAYFAAFRNHIGFYALPSGNEDFKKELQHYKTGKGSIQFPLNEPMPLDLIIRIVKRRANENLQKIKMRKITSFIFLTVNGCFKGLNDDTSWHVHNEEANEYSEKQLEPDNILLFGRKTYEMMNSFWPTTIAYESFPKVAERMNSSEKIVLSNSIINANWQNTKVFTGVEQIKSLKSTPWKDIAILGSGTLITQLTDAGPIDEYEFLIGPLAIGKGTPLFENIQNNLELSLSTKLTSSFIISPFPYIKAKYYFAFTSLTNRSAVFCSLIL